MRAGASGAGPAVAGCVTDRDESAVCVRGAAEVDLGVAIGSRGAAEADLGVGSQVRQIDAEQSGKRGNPGVLGCGDRLARQRLEAAWAGPAWADAADEERARPRPRPEATTKPARRWDVFKVTPSGGQWMRRRSRAAPVGTPGNWRPAEALDRGNRLSCPQAGAPLGAGEEGNRFSGAWGLAAGEGGPVGELGLGIWSGWAGAQHNDQAPARSHREGSAR